MTCHHALLKKIPHNPISIVMSYHGNTYFGLDPTLLTYCDVRDLREFQPYIKDLCVGDDPGFHYDCDNYYRGGTPIRLTIRLSEDTFRFLIENRKQVEIYYATYLPSNMMYRTITNTQLLDFHKESIKIDDDSWINVKNVYSIKKRRIL